MSRKAPAGFGRGVPEKDREAPRRYPTSAADPETKRKAIENAYESLTPEPLPSWTADQDLLEWLDRFCR